jgi:hypothetical protein
MKKTKDTSKQRPVRQALTPAAVDNTLSLVLDTGADEEKMLRLGFSKKQLRRTEERLIQFNRPTLKPAFEEVKDPIMLKVDRPIFGMGQIKNPDNGVVITAVFATNRTYYLVKKERAVFNFTVDRTSLCMKDAVREMLQSNLLKGPRVFGMTANIVKDFWIKLFQSVCTRPEIMEIQLRTMDDKMVSSRLYFNPKRPDDATLSVGGWCFPFNLVDFPKKAMAEGTRLWLNDQAKRAKVEQPRLVPTNGMVIKPSNKRRQAVAA